MRDSRPGPGTRIYPVLSCKQGLSAAQFQCMCVCVCLQQTKYLKTVEGCSTNHQRKAEAAAEAAASASGASELSSCSVQGEENKTKIVDGKIKVRVSRSTVDGRRVPAALLLFCLVFGGATAQERRGERQRESERGRGPGESLNRESHRIAELCGPGQGHWTRD